MRVLSPLHMTAVAPDQAICSYPVPNAVFGLGLRQSQKAGLPRLVYVDQYIIIDGPRITRTTSTSGKQRLPRFLGQPPRFGLILIAMMNDHPVYGW
ncbi:MAG: hypothetical protein ACR65R_14345 [Methylomicrobium sp.]